MRERKGLFVANSFAIELYTTAVLWFGIVYFALHFIDRGLYYPAQSPRFVFLPLCMVMKLAQPSNYNTQSWSFPLLAIQVLGLFSHTLVQQKH